MEVCWRLEMACRWKKTLEEGYDEAVYRQLLISLARDQVEKDKDADIAAYIKLEKEANAARYLTLPRGR